MRFLSFFPPLSLTHHYFAIEINDSLKYYWYTDTIWMRMCNVSTERNTLKIESNKLSGTCSWKTRRSSASARSKVLPPCIYVSDIQLFVRFPMDSSELFPPFLFIIRSSSYMGFGFCVHLRQEQRREKHVKTPQVESKPNGKATSIRS